MNDYHQMSIKEKQAHALARAREPSIVCPACETQTTAADLLEHMQSRCSGRREPHPAAVWISWGAALKLGVQPVALSRSVARGQVRMRGERLDREYLLRDVVALVAARRMRPCRVEIVRVRRRKFQK